MRWLGLPLGLKFENCGTTDQPAITLSVWSHGELGPAFVSSLVEEINYRYGFQLDLSAFYARFRDDPKLGPVIGRWRGMRPLNCNSLYEYLMISIVLQNATVRRSVHMMQALFGQYGAPLQYDGKVRFCFWLPEVIDNATESELRALKVGYRAKSIKRVSAAFAHQEIDEQVLRTQTKEEQRRALLGLYGIGPASVGYLMSDVFHHLDELNHISLWEQKIYSKLFFDRDPEDPVDVATLLAVFDQRYGEYKMLAVHYFWEDLFWRRQHEHVDWLEKLIRL
jgi:N-glycosylase/DNA lyase